MKPLRTLVFVGLMASGLSGCGIRGPLEAPPGVGAPEVKASAAKEAFGTADLLPRRPKPTPVDVPKQSFFLDPLLR